MNSWTLRRRRAAPAVFPRTATFPAPAGDHDHRRRAILLVGIALLSIGMWQIPIGQMLLYPFSILATWFHEMGHGLAALLTGSRFERLLIFPDGSGVALSLRPADGYRVTGALIAASGPMGPAIAGALLIVASRTVPATKRALTVLGLALILSTLIWVRTLIGWVVLPSMGLVILAIARLGRPSLQRLSIQVLGVQACISVWRQLWYLFSEGGMIAGRMHRSDTGAIEDALFLPYWVWGGSISIVIGVLLWWSLRTALRR